MIQVPEEVKALCMQDSINKNFRVLFPNGEYRDLVNADIVAESVVFTESIGSTTGLQFGLCEGATLEFQTFFNENIRNLKIKAGIEIDISSLVEGEVHTDTVNVEVESSSYNVVIYQAQYTGTYTFYSSIGAIDNTRYVDMELNQGDIVELEVPPTSSSGVPAGTYTVNIKIVVGIVPDYAQFSDDVPYPFYYIPYGIFYVDSCKRSGQDNTRKVVAYQNKWELDNSPMFELSDVEKKKMCVRTIANSGDYTLDVLKFICGCLHSSSLLNSSVLSPTTLDSNVTMEFTEYTTSYGNFYSSPISSSTVHNYTTFRMSGLKISIKSQNQDRNKLYVLKYANSIDLDKLADELVDVLYQFGGVSVEKSDLYKYVFAPRFIFDRFKTHVRGRSSTTSGIIDYWTTLGTGSYAFPGIGYENAGNPEYISDSEIVFYPYCSAPYYQSRYNNQISQTSDQPPFEVFVPIQFIGYSDSHGHTWTGGYDIMDVNTLSDFNLMEYTDNTCNITFERQVDSGRFMYFDLNNNTWVEDPNNYIPSMDMYSLKYVADNIENYINTKEIANSLVELQGGFLKLDRNEFFEVINLKGRKGLYPREDLYPLPNTPVEDALYPQGPDHLVSRVLWRDVWYEDKVSNPYDKVCCTWKNTSGEDVYKEIVLVDTSQNSMLARDYQSYDISNNYFIKTQGLLTEAQVDDILENLANILKDVQYYVADIDMRGLPYMEAGDSISVLTRTNGFDTFCMRHRISGIHALMDSIEAR